MLDPYMQYSCGYWKEAQSLEAAQQAKLDLICRKLELEPGMRVLDIGCGWGGLAEYMARNYQVSVVGVTISAEQQKMARARCADLDVEIRLGIIAICTTALTASSPLACLSTWGRKITLPTLRLPTVI